MFKNIKNEFIQQWLASTPERLLPIKNELDQWMHQFMSAWLAKHDLVTREEFNHLLDLLEATHQRLAQVQTQLKQVESKCSIQEEA